MRPQRDGEEDDRQKAVVRTREIRVLLSIIWFNDRGPRLGVLHGYGNDEKTEIDSPSSISSLERHTTSLLIVRALKVV